MIAWEAVPNQSFQLHFRNISAEWTNLGVLVLKLKGVSGDPENGGGGREES